MQKSYENLLNTKIPHSPLFVVSNLNYLIETAFQVIKNHVKENILLEVLKVYDKNRNISKCSQINFTKWVYFYLIIWWCPNRWKPIHLIIFYFWHSIYLKQCYCHLIPKIRSEKVHPVRVGGSLNLLEIINKF